MTPTHAASATAAADAACRTAGRGPTKPCARTAAAPNSRPPSSGSSTATAPCSRAPEPDHKTDVFPDTIHRRTPPRPIARRNLAEFPSRESCAQMTTAAGLSPASRAAIVSARLTRSPEFRADGGDNSSNFRRAPPASRSCRGGKRAAPPRGSRGMRNPWSGRRALRSAACCRRPPRHARLDSPGLALTKASRDLGRASPDRLVEFEIVRRDLHHRARLAHGFEIGARRQSRTGAVPVPFMEDQTRARHQIEHCRRRCPGRAAAPAPGSTTESPARIAATARARRKRTAARRIAGRGARLGARSCDGRAVGRRPGQRQHVEIEMARLVWAGARCLALAQKRRRQRGKS